MSNIPKINQRKMETSKEKKEQIDPTEHTMGKEIASISTSASSTSTEMRELDLNELNEVIETITNAINPPLVTTLAPSVTEAVIKNEELQNQVRDLQEQLRATEHNRMELERELMERQCEPNLKKETTFEENLENRMLEASEDDLQYLEQLLNELNRHDWTGLFTLCRRLRDVVGDKIDAYYKKHPEVIVDDD